MKIKQSLQVFSLRCSIKAIEVVGILVFLTAGSDLTVNPHKYGTLSVAVASMPALIAFLDLVSPQTLESKIQTVPSFLRWWFPYMARAFGTGFLIVGAIVLFAPEHYSVGLSLEIIIPALLVTNYGYRDKYEPVTS